MQMDDRTKLTEGHDGIARPSNNNDTFLMLISSVQHLQVLLTQHQPTTSTSKVPIAHRAMPTRMMPFRYPGKSGSVAQAMPVISKGPTIQFMKRDRPSCHHMSRWPSMDASSSYRTV